MGGCTVNSVYMAGCTVNSVYMGGCTVNSVYMGGCTVNSVYMGGCTVNSVYMGGIWLASKSFGPSLGIEIKRFLSVTVCDPLRACGLDLGVAPLDCAEAEVEEVEEEVEEDGNLFRDEFRHHKDAYYMEKLRYEQVTP